MFDPVGILRSWPEFTMQPPSEHLINCFRSIGDAVTAKGRPVHDRSTVINLTTSIASRSYGPELYRAVHLLAALAITDTSIDQLILPESPITGSAVIALLQNGKPADGLVIETHILCFGIHGNSGEQMKISARQLPAAVALIEFLIESLGFEAIHQAYEKLTQNLDSAKISAVTKKLSAALYQFLGEHLPSASNRQMVQLLSNYILNTQKGITSINPEDITDELIYEFWCAHANDDSVSFRLFATAAQAWVTYRNALNLASTDAFSLHVSIDQMQEDGQIDRVHHYQSQSYLDDDDYPKPGTSSLAEIVLDINAPSQWLHDLVSPPCDSIKLFTKVEQEYIAFPLMAGSAASALLLTCLRVAVFSPLQNKIVQTKRSKRNKDDIRECDDATLFEKISDDAYSDIIQQWQEMVTVASGLRDTAYYRLWEAKDPQFFTYFVDAGTEDERLILSEISLEQSEKVNDLQIIGNYAETIANALFATLETLPKSHLLYAKKAKMKEIAHRYRRKGLMPNHSIDADKYKDWIHALLVSGERLSKIHNFLRDLSNGANSRMAQLQTHFEQDKHNFKARLKSLYEV